MKSLKHTLFIFCLALFSFVALSPAATGIKPVKYVILMIGDGMGPEEVNVAQEYLRATSGDPESTLWLNRLPVKGATSTYSANDPITDSAAAATALACGRKTNNKMIGMDTHGRPLQTVGELAKQAGRRVGIITSVPIDHATPAAFYAHQLSRNNYYEIAASLPQSGFDYFAGQPFLGTDQAKGRPAPVELAKSAGYQIVENEKAFNDLHAGTEQVVVLAPLPYAIDAKGELSLADLTRKGLELLDNPKGFFLIVEGGKIDWAGHANDLAANIKETLAFDEAVATAVSFYNAHQAETLLLITADHETGGLQLDFKKPFNAGVIDQQMISGATFGHIVKQWKKADIPFEQAMKELESRFGLADLTLTEQQSIRQAFDAFMAKPVSQEIAAALAKMYGTKNPVVTACQNIVAKRCGVQWNTFHHTPKPVPTRAAGVNSQLFEGETDNSEIGQNLKKMISTY